MTVGEVCTRDVVSVRKEDGILDVSRLMRDRHVGDVVVVEGDGAHRRPVGILTDRDVVVGIVAQAPDKLAQLQVRDVFVVGVLTVNEQDSIETAVDLMRDRGIRRLPVVDFEGRLRGIITFDDVLRVLARQLLDLTHVVGRERRREELYRI